MSGRIVPECADPAIREIIYGNYRVIYRVRGDVVELLTIFHGARASVVIDVEGSDWEDLVIQSDPAFWGTMRERRKEKSISRGEMRRRVLSRAETKPCKRRG